jgi:hypothetical protein
MASEKSFIELVGDPVRAEAFESRVLSVLACGVLLGAALVGERVHADPVPALDRQLVERMVRALEDQSRAIDRLVNATEKCKR